MPSPPSERAIERFALDEELEHLGSCSGAMPIPVSSTAMTSSSPSDRGRELDAASDSPSTWPRC